LDKSVVVYSETTIPAVYRFLPHVGCIVKTVSDAHTFDLAVVLDCGDLERVGSWLRTSPNAPKIINIDHHVTNTGFGDYQMIDTSACATTEIVYRIIKEMDIPIDKGIATSIYTGILTDTGSFRFSNTTPAAFAISEEMVRLGVNPYEVAQHVYGTYSLGRIKLLLRALNSIELSKNGKMSMMALTQTMLRETETKAEDVDGLINYARSIKDIQLAVLIEEKTNGVLPVSALKEFHVSLRSNGSVDVAQIASSFGGGGHPSAAGFTIESTLPELKSQLFELAKTL
jgi:phosphoesterase RecJ-like protein